MNFIKKNIFGVMLCIVVAGIATLLGGLKVGSVSLDVIGAPVFAILMITMVSIGVQMLYGIYYTNL